VLLQRKGIGRARGGAAGHQTYLTFAGGAACTLSARVCVLEGGKGELLPLQRGWAGYGGDKATAMLIFRLSFKSGAGVSRSSL